MVLQQLNTSSTISYAKFMRYGYPKRLILQELVNLCRPLENELKSFERTVLYKKCFLSLGLELKDFKMGNNTIFFRLNKFNLIEKFIHDLKNNSTNTLNRIKKTILRWKWRQIIYCVRFASNYSCPILQFAVYTDN